MDWLGRASVKANETEWKTNIKKIEENRRSDVNDFSEVSSDKSQSDVKYLCLDSKNPFQIASIDHSVLRLHNILSYKLKFIVVH